MFLKHFDPLKDGKTEDNNLDNQQKFLHSLQNALQEVMKNFDDLEGSVKKYPVKTLPNKVNALGNLSTLHRDQDEDSVALLNDYNHSLRSYNRITGKLKEMLIVIKIFNKV